MRKRVLSGAVVTRLCYCAGNPSSIPAGPVAGFPTFLFVLLLSSWAVCSAVASEIWYFSGKRVGFHNNNKNDVIKGKKQTIDHC